MQFLTSPVVQARGSCRSPHRAALAGVLALGLLPLGCDRSDLIEAVGQVRPWEGSTAGPNVTVVPFTGFVDEVGDKAQTERRVLLKTREAYQSFFGHGPPASVDFARDWVIFYAAGTKPSGGFSASLHALAVVDLGSETLLQAVTRLASPGPGCPVTDALTTPHVLVKFAAQTTVFNIDFSRSDVTGPNCGAGHPCEATLCAPDTRCIADPDDPGKARCVPYAGCKAVKCAAGTHCVEQEVQCVRAPCLPVAACVPDEPKVFCGGIAAIKCPGVGRCEDDPSDSCDPKNGGADCGGMCTCRTTANCVTGHVFDPSPSVCTCVPQK